jgi:hypothetical protein
VANDRWTQTTQQATLATAVKWGEGWTLTDLAFVEAFADQPDAEVAQALGRTLFSIQTIKHAIRAGKVRPGEHAARTRRVTAAGAYRGWVEGMGDGA